MHTQSWAISYTSSNLRKHTHTNPLQRCLLQRFHYIAAQLITQTMAHTILDAGCGEGFAMRHLLGNLKNDLFSSQTIGLDGSVTALHIARQLLSHHSFVSGDLQYLPFATHSFDLVICLEVLEHLDQPARGLSELCRVSRRWVLLSVPNEPFFRGANFLRGKNVRAWGNDPGHVNHWSTSAFLRFVSYHCQVVAWRTSFPWTLALCHTA